MLESHLRLKGSDSRALFSTGMKRTVTQDDQAPKPEDESLALLFRDHYVAIEAF
jgi:hypothetical protein